MRSSDFVITCMITDRIGLHSVLLILPISMFGSLSYVTLCCVGSIYVRRNEGFFSEQRLVIEPSLCGVKTLRAYSYAQRNEQINERTSERTNERANESERTNGQTSLNERTSERRGGGGGGLEALPIIQRVKVQASFHRCKQNLFRIHDHWQVFTLLPLRFASLL